MAEPKLLKLHSPAYGEPIYYNWPLVMTKKHDEPTEIVETIKLVCDDFPELRFAVENVMLKDYDVYDYTSMNQLCQRYNKAIRNILLLWKGRAPPPRMFKPPSKELLRHIINLCYSHGIKQPEKLNSYEPFSPEVYGETSFDMVAQILEDVSRNAKETFIDLGSGVGQVVLQAAASNQFKECIGVEKADIPAYFAVEMETQFKKWMKWYGKIYTEFKLIKGDFMESKWQDVVNEAGVVFVNNFAFGPVVNHHLKAMFQSMKEGAKVISSREFCPMNFKFNKRNLSELGVMMHVAEIRPRSEASVSWTGNTVSYYMHTVDRTRLEKYFAILQKKKEGCDLDEDETSLYSESNFSLDASTSAGTTVNIETLEDNLDDLYLGTTTRHQWQLLTDTIQQSRNDVHKPTTQGKEKTEEAKKKSLQRRSIVKKPMELKNKAIKNVQSLKKTALLHNSYPTSLSSYSSHEDEEKDPEFKVESRTVLPKKRKRQINNEEVAKNTATTPETSPLEKDVDEFFGKMKERYMGFIAHMNTEEYANRLKKIIESETIKQRYLERGIIETEFVVRSLVSSALKLFSKRLNKLGILVKTPQELLTKSSELSHRHRELETKVVTMETEIEQLEGKYRKVYSSENENVGSVKALVNNDESLFPDTLDKKNTGCDTGMRLCGAIMSALSQRRVMIDRQKTLSEQISLLEKVSPEVVEDEPNDPAVSVKSTEPKTRPVAFVPPRMLSEDKSETLSPPVSLQSLMLPEIHAPNFPVLERAPQVVPSNKPSRGRPKRRGKDIKRRAEVPMTVSFTSTAESVIALQPPVASRETTSLSLPANPLASLSQREVGGAPEGSNWPPHMSQLAKAANEFEQMRHQMLSTPSYITSKYQDIRPADSLKAKQRKKKNEYSPYYPAKPNDVVADHFYTNNAAPTYQWQTYTDQHAAVKVIKKPCDLPNFPQTSSVLFQFSRATTPVLPKVTPSLSPRMFVTSSPYMKRFVPPNKVDLRPSNQKNLFVTLPVRMSHNAPGHVIHSMERGLVSSPAVTQVINWNSKTPVAETMINKPQKLLLVQDSQNKEQPGKARQMSIASPTYPPLNM